MIKFKKNKLLYPFYGILFFFVFAILMIIGLNKNAWSKNNVESNFYPGTIWSKTDNEIGASKKIIAERSNIADLKTIDFSEDIIIPTLTDLPEIPLTEEDK